MLLYLCPRLSHRHHNPLGRRKHVELMQGSDNKSECNLKYTEARPLFAQTHRRGSRTRLRGGPGTAWEW